jgi:hypothetical protein
MFRIHAMIVCAALLAAAATASAAEVALGSDAAEGPHLDVDTHLPMGPILLTSFSAVAVAIGAGFGWEAHQGYDDWKQARDTGDPYGDMDGIADDVRKHSIAADVLMLGGAAVAIVGIIWWIRAAKRGDEKRRDAVSFTPVLGPAQAGALVEF